MKITPVLSRSCCEKLLHAALTNQGDILGYRDFGGPSDDEDEVDQSTESDRVEFLAELAADALGGGQPGVLSKLLTTSVTLRMDPVTAALLTHIGIVPSAALVLREKVLAERVGCEILDGDIDDGFKVAIGFDESWELVVDTERDVHWSSEGTLMVGPMPETLAIAAAGRPLREIVSHPALDPMDITVESIETGPERSIVRLAGYRDDAMATLSPRQLESMRQAVLKKAA